MSAWRRAETVMGTVVSFDVRPGSQPDADVALAMADARAALHRADAVFSTWKPHSPINQLRRGRVGLEHLPPEVSDVLELCRELHDMTGGWFDPWAAPGGVDPTGLVKGWAAEQALACLVRAGIPGAMVSAGGDVALWGRPEADRPWRLGVQNPFERSSIIAVVEPPGAIATSGCYERGAHIYDPRTGAAAGAFAGATVTGPRLHVADALATALVAGGDEALAHVERIDGYEAFVVRPDGSSEATGGFPFAAEPAGARG